MSDLTKRLRGIYEIPVNDGAGPLDGKNTFTRTFDNMPPICIEAADRIDALEECLRDVVHDIQRYLVERTVGNRIGINKTIAQARALLETSGMNAKISREQFIKEYCAQSGRPWWELSQWRMVIPCDCGEDVCKGWAMVPRPAVEDHIGDPEE